MKVYRLPNGIVISGKAWEIRAKLREYGRTYRYMKDWISYERR
ncbi:Z-ring formation inhibitor MciZ [Bacillus sonorensis]|nr:Z-ring formation inhibitor MciZ [Bacillus sonorensis]MEC1536450.1 Z-ring formation inhibitor MciZ [Bacillus sonorensis]MEC1588183.1 Z-ring formation inhibitor MciZ [Bacillus sonorensis]